MTSKSHLFGEEERLRYFQIAHQYFSQDNYQQAVLFARKANQCGSPQPHISLLLSQCEYLLLDFPKALQHINEAISSVESNGRAQEEALLLKIKLLDQRSKVYKKLNDLRNCKKDLEEIKRIVQGGIEGSSATKESLKKIEEEVNLEIQHLENDHKDATKKEKSLPEREKEAEIVYELFELSEKKKMLSTEFGMVHIVSMKWFEHWRKYTNFRAVQTRKENKDAKTNEDELTDDEDAEEAAHPGPINSNDILDLESSHLLDPEIKEDYSNYIIKQGLIENKDFFIFSHLVWTYLHSIYSGQDIKRYILNKDRSGNTTFVEVWLKKVNVLVCPPVSRSYDFSECRVHAVYLSRKNTVQDLVEKIIRIYQGLYKIDLEDVDFSSYQVWKLDQQQLNPRELIKKSQISNDEMKIKGDFLSDDLLLENAEISDMDTVVCEFRIRGQFKYINDENQQVPVESVICSFCQQQKENLLLCPCKAARYCDSDCQKMDWPQHKAKCQKLRAASIKASHMMKEFKISDTKFTATSRYGLCGLQNLGNTCFMNSALQCLSNVKELTDYFLENRFVKDLNRENKLGTGGRCATAYAELVKQLWHGTSSYVSPWEVKRMLSVLASQFEGFSQQDAQEFLAYLLDGIHEDLDRVSVKPYIETLEAHGADDAQVAKESWQNHLKRNQSIIVDLMHGQFKSKVVCPDCGRSPITFDPFVNVSLPIPSFNLIPLQVFFVFKNANKLPYKLTLNLPPEAHAPEIIDALAEELVLPKETIELRIVHDNSFVKVNIKELTVKAVKEYEGLAFAYQLYDEELDGPLKEFLNQEKFKIEVQIYHQAGKNEGSDHESFSRLLHLPVKAAVFDLNIQVYALMREYIRNLFVAEPKHPAFFEIDLTQNDKKTLIEEYKNLAKSKGLLYELVTRPKQSKRKASTPIPEDHVKLDDIIQGAKEFILEVIFNYKVDVQHMRLNKCKAHDLENPTTKEPGSYTIYDCLELFSKPEVLDKDNSWYCNKCKDQKQATKKMDLYKLPKILIIHLKRFKTNKIHSIGSFYFSGGSQKVSTLVEFPLEGLDLSKYALEKIDVPPIYDLVGVVNHYGGLGGGHYTAFGKNSEKNEWYEFDDSTVSKQSPDRIVSKAAYILFYRRRDSEKLNGSSS